MSNVLDLKLLSDKSYRISEAIKTLRTNVLFSGVDINCIAVTSSIANEGKSVISLELAASLAKTDKKVLLVDADMRNSAMRRRHKLKKSLGLSQYLTDQATLDEVICQTQIEKLDVIMCGFCPPNPAELLQSDRFTSILSKMKERYDYVIIDTPPLGAVIDAVIIAKSCDGTVIIVGNDTVSLKLARSVRNQLVRAECKVIGAVLNFADTDNRSRYNYRYRYQYQYPHKKSSNKD